MTRLKPVSPSMGMMLETTSRRLFETQGRGALRLPRQGPGDPLAGARGRRSAVDPVHHGAAGRDRRDLTERAETIFELRRIARLYGSIQEVIVQNFRAKPDTAMRHADDLGLAEYRAAIAVSRIVLGPTMRIQAPPNLVDTAECRALLDAGVDDWGGVSPLTPDHVNPERPWPSIERLRAVTAEAGFELAPRLTVHPHYVAPAHPVARPAPRRPRRRTRAARRTRAHRRTTRGEAVAGARRRTSRAPAAPTSTRPSTPSGRTSGSARGLRQRVRRLGGGRRESAAGTCAARHRLTDSERGVRRTAGRRGRPGRPQRRPGAGPDDRRGRAAGAGLPPGRRPAPGHRRRRRHLRRQPQHQLHQHLLRRLPVLRVRPAQDRRRRVLALPRPGRRPGARRPGSSAPPRSACRAGSTRSCRRRPTSTSSPRSSSACPACTCTPSARWRSSAARRAPACRSRTS